MVIFTARPFQRFPLKKSVDERNPIDLCWDTMATAKQTTMRLADEDLAILDVIQERIGLFSRSDALRFALRHYARTEGIDIAKPKPKPKPKK